MVLLCWVLSLILYSVCIEKEGMGISKLIRPFSILHYGQKIIFKMLVLLQLCKNHPLAHIHTLTLFSMLGTGITITRVTFSVLKAKLGYRLTNILLLSQGFHKYYQISLFWCSIIRWCLNLHWKCTLFSSVKSFRL